MRPMRLLPENSAAITMSCFPSAPRPRFPEPLPGIFGVFDLQRSPPARRRTEGAFHLNISSTIFFNSKVVLGAIPFAERTAEQLQLLILDDVKEFNLENKKLRTGLGFKFGN